MNMFAQTKTILTPTYLRERMAPPAPAKLDLRHGVILYLEDINVSFDGFKALNNLNLYINKGELRCIIGPNGSGKSTLIKTLAGILEPCDGNITLDERDISKISKNEVAKKIGYVPQDFQFLTSASVLEAVILGRRPHVQWSLSRSDLAKVDAAMEMLNISSMAQKMLTELSGGERQRVFIARAIAQEPDYFLFDEPTSALDIRHQIDVFQMVKKIAGLLSKGVVKATKTDVKQIPQKLIIDV